MITYIQKGILFLIAIAIGIGIVACSQKKTSEETANTTITSTVVANLSAVSADFTPTSLQTVSGLTYNPMSKSEVQTMADPCEGASSFAVCQSNLIREYLTIGKNMVDLLGLLAGGIGNALGGLADGASGTSQDGKIVYNKTSATSWSILTKGTGGASVAYFSVNGGTYTLKLDNANAEEDPSSIQTEAVVNFTDADNWSVDVFFSKSECDPLDVGAPSKAQIRIAKAAGLWTGKAMLYHPRWNEPGVSVSCATAAGLHEIAMYTDFVGNDDSTKAALYLIPGAVSDLSGIASYDLPDFCTNFSSACGGAGEPTSGLLASFPNNWCTTGPSTEPTWNDDCSSNAPVAAAAFSAASDWIVPTDLKAKSLTLPTSLLE